VRRVKVVAVVVGLLAVSLVAVDMAGAAGFVPTTNVVARVLPKHINPPSIKKANYTWHVHGNITYPSYYCPNGTHNPPYCARVPKSSACKGKITYTVRMGSDKLLAASGKKIGSGSTTLRGNCTYKFSKHFRTSLFISRHRLKNDKTIRHLGVLFYVHFAGNSVLTARNARVQTVIAKVLQP